MSSSGAILKIFCSDIVDMFSQLMHVITIKWWFIKLLKTFCFCVRSLEISHLSRDIYTGRFTPVVYKIDIDCPPSWVYCWFSNPLTESIYGTGRCTCYTSFGKSPLKIRLSLSSGRLNNIKKWLNGKMLAYKNLYLSTNCYFWWLGSQTHRVRLQNVLMIFINLHESQFTSYHSHLSFVSGY